MDDRIGPRPELVERAVELSQALREHAQAAQGLMSILRDSSHLTALLVACVPSDNWTSVWEVRRTVHRDELRNQLRLANELDVWRIARSRANHPSNYAGRP